MLQRSEKFFFADDCEAKIVKCDYAAKEVKITVLPIGHILINKVHR